MITDDCQLSGQADQGLRCRQTSQGGSRDRTGRSAEADRLEAATELKDLAVLPGNRFETLKGDRKGEYSIRINDQWRICFEWPDGSPGPINVEIVDYH